MIQRGRREARPLPSAVAQCRSAVAQCRSERGLHVDDVACEVKVGRKTEIDYLLEDFSESANIGGFRFPLYSVW